MQKFQFVSLVLSGPWVHSSESPRRGVSTGFKIIRQMPKFPLRELEVLPTMPPATSRRTTRDTHSQSLNNVQSTPTPNVDLFTDPMMGGALAFYIDKDVQDKERVSQLITACLPSI